MKLLFSILLFLSILLPLTSIAELQQYDGIKIESVSISSPEGIDIAGVEAKIEALKGQLFSSNKMNALLKTLYQTNLFHNIHIHVLTTQKGRDKTLTLSFVIELKKRITEITFSGNSLYSESFLRKTIALKTGTRFSVQDVETNRRLLQNLYEENGFFQTKIQVRFSSASVPHEITILFELEEGAPCTIQEISIESIGKPKSKSIKSLLSLEEGDTYRPADLKDEIQNLKKYFFKKRYLSAVFYAENIVFNADKSHVRIFLKVRPGPQYFFEFTGLHEFSEYELLSPFLYSEDRGYTTSIEEILNHILDSYHQEGYQHAEVGFKSSLDENENKKHILFYITENFPVKISGFVVHGNKQFDEEYYQSLIYRLASPSVRRKMYNPTDIDVLPRLISDHLKTVGFLFPKISLQNLNWDADRRHVMPEFFIEEGPRTLVKKVTVSGNHFFSNDEILKVLDVSLDQPLDLTTIDSDLNRLIDHYRENGYLMCKIENAGTDRLVFYSPDLTKATLDIRIIEGPQIKIGDIIFRGSVRTRTRVMERELTFDKGDPWNPQEIDQTENHLLKLGLFSSVTIHPLQKEFGPGENDIVVDVTERMPGLTELGGGFKTDDGFHAFSGIAYRNIGGWNRAASLRGEANRKIRTYRFLEREIELAFSEPYLFTIPFIARLNVTHKKESSLPFDEKSWGGTFSLDKSLWDFLKVGFQYSLEYRDIFRAIDLRDVQDKVITSFGPSLFFDFRDDPFNPKNGSSHTLSNLWFLPELGGDEEVSLSRSLASSTWYYSPWSWLTLASSVRGGYAKSFSSTFPIPVDKRFYLGGRSSIRGFREDIIGSDTKNKQIFETSYINYKTELQFFFLSDIGIAGFFDGGNVFFDSPITGNRFRHSIGPGIRYQTPIGPLSIDYGFILARNRAAGEPQGSFHLAIGLF